MVRLRNVWGGAGGLVRTDPGGLSGNLLRNDAAAHICPGIPLWSSNMDLDRYVTEWLAVLGDAGNDCAHLFIEAIHFG